MDYYIIGKRIKDRRKALNMSQERLAELINRSTNFVSNLETGKKGASIDSIILVSEALNFSLDELLIGRVISHEDPYLEVIESIFQECTESEKSFVVEMIIHVCAQFRGYEIRKHNSKITDYLKKP